VLTRDRQGGRVRIGRGGQPVYRYRPDAEVLAHMRRGIEAAVRVHLAAGARAVSTLHVSRPVLRRSEQLPSAEVDRFCEHVGRLALHRNWSTIFSAHQMGTCRMGSDPRTAVCNSNGQVFGVGGLYVADASAFPASSGVNPMITIMALAHHVAQSIKEE
jgi:choline dehydrogenase-like flavoprotein